MLRRTFAATACALLLIPALATAAVDKFNVDPAHSEVGFTVRHLVSKVSGRFNQFEGTVMLDQKDPSSLSVDGKVQVGSVDTNQSARDKHLKSDDFFSAEKFPELTFKSTKVAKNGDKWSLTGDLTMRGVTKPVTLELAILGFAPVPEQMGGGVRAGFEATGRVSRKDFGINGAAQIVGDDVDILIRVEAALDKGTTK